MCRTSISIFISALFLKATISFVSLPKLTWNKISNRNIKTLRLMHRGKSSTSSAYVEGFRLCDDQQVGFQFPRSIKHSMRASTDILPNEVTYQ